MKWNTPTETGWFVNLAEGGSAVSIFDPSGNVQGELIPASDDGIGERCRRAEEEIVNSRAGSIQAHIPQRPTCITSIVRRNDRDPDRPEAQGHAPQEQAVRSRYRGQNIPLRSFIGPKGNSPA